MLALVLRAGVLPRETTFVTPSESTLQLGYVTYPADGVVPRHFHKPLERNIIGTLEVLIVSKGRCIADFYDTDRRLVATTELRERDTILLLSGGHGFRMVEDTVLMEVKQGPYTGLEEKERF